MREQGADKPKRLMAPGCVHLYVWIFMITFSLSPVLWLLAAHNGFEHRDALGAFELVALTQVMLYFTQRRCSSEDLLYWEGLLAAAASVTTGVNLTSLLRTFPLLLAIVILSVEFALDHDENSPVRHAQIRFGKLIIWTHKQRLRGGG